MTLRKSIADLQKCSSPEPFVQTWRKTSLGEGNSRFTNKSLSIIKKEMIDFSSPNQGYDISIVLTNVFIDLNWFLR